VTEKITMYQTRESHETGQIPFTAVIGTEDDTKGVEGKGDPVDERQLHWENT